MKGFRVRWPAFAVFGAALGVIGTAAVLVKGKEDHRRDRRIKADPKDVVGPSPRWRGPADARAVVVEFGDPTCHACRRLAPAVANVIASGGSEIAYVYRSVPRRDEAASLAAVRWIESAERDREFWSRRERAGRSEVPTGVSGSSKAERRMVQNERAAGRLGVRRIPAWFVVTSDGGAYVAEDPSALAALLR